MGPFTWQIRKRGHRRALSSQRSYRDGPKYGGYTAVSPKLNPELRRSGSIRTGIVTKCIEESTLLQPANIGKCGTKVLAVNKVRQKLGVPPPKMN